MAEIDYFGIEEEIKKILLANVKSNKINGRKLIVKAEEVFEPTFDNCPLVLIYLDAWDSPPEDELIGGSRPVRTKLMIIIWFFQASLENRQVAMLRDSGFAKIKEVLKSNRNLNGKVLMTRFEGGEFQNPVTSQGFIKGVSMKLEVEVRE